MTWLTFDELDAEADAFDAQIARTPEIDPFCSSSSWILPAARSVASEAQPFILKGDAGFIAMMLGTVGGGYVAAMPLEFGWGLAAPFAGPDPDALVDQLNWMWSQRADEIDALLISGIPIDGLWMGALTRRLSRTIACRSVRNRSGELRPLMVVWMAFSLVEVGGSERMFDVRLVVVSRRTSASSIIQIQNLSAFSSALSRLKRIAGKAEREQGSISSRLKTSIAGCFHAWPVALN